MRVIILMTMHNYLPLSVRPYFQAKMLAIFAWAFSCGLPLMLVTGTLSAYLAEQHVSLSTIGLFSFATLPYSLKYFFAPFIETYSLPFLGKYIGRARTWIVIAMIGMMISILWMGSLSSVTNHSLTGLFIATFITVLCSSIADTAEAEYRIELLKEEEFSHGMACYGVGYRLGMITGGGVAILIAAVSSWQLAYYVMAALISMGVLAVFLQPHANPIKKRSKLTIRYLWQGYISPFKDLMQRPAWLSMMALVLLYSFSDSLLSMALNPFLLKIGISLSEISLWQGSLGGVMSIVGGLLCGGLIAKYGMTRMLFLCTVFLLITNALFIPLAMFSIAKLPWLYYLFQLEALLGNFFMGMSAIVYITFLASQCRIPFTASQNALLTSFMAASKVMLTTLSGYFIVTFGWSAFFIMLCLFSFPILMLVYCYRNQQVRIFSINTLTQQA